MPGFVLAGPLFSIWSALIEERTGIHYGPEDRELLESKLQSRAIESGFESLLDYYYFIRYDAEATTELDAVVDALVINETYFFRESDPLRVLCDTVLAPLVARGEQPRVWCAACSTGEEPLTLAMMLAERGLLSKVSIVASDIAVRVLNVAKKGVYGERSLRAFSHAVAKNWITMEGNKALVKRELIETIDWRRINLTDEKTVGELGLFDAILCRNVLIYFRDETIRRVVGTLSNALKPGAPLVVGASESLLRFGTLLQCEERAGAFFYVRNCHG